VVLITNIRIHLGSLAKIMHKAYLDGDLTPAEFRDWYNDPNNYRPELPGNNRGHAFE